jgi:F0F1-type ATP synthase delta subunit
MAFWPLLTIQIVVFLVLVVGLRRLLTKNLTSASLHLQRLNAEYTKRHEDLKQRVEEAERQYKDQMMRAKTEADLVAAQAKQDAESTKTRILDEARGESERIVRQALDSQDALRKELEQAMEARAIERACELIQQSLPGELRQAIQSQWLDELIQNGLQQLDALKTDDGLREVKVVSAFPLNDAQRRVLQERLKKKAGHEVTLVEEADERLIAGLILTLGSLVLDGSLASKVRGAAARVRKADENN